MVGSGGNKGRRRSLAHALAARERTGRASLRDLQGLLPRQRWTMDQVLSLEDCAVLLGFSSDGNYLVYYSLWESTYLVIWKRIRSAFAAERVELSVALRLRVGNHGSMTRSFDGPNVSSRLRVWQSTDDQVVVVVAIENPLTSQDSGASYHFTLSPSPVYCSVRGCAKSRSLSFSYTLPSPNQEVEAWQLLSLGNERYSLVLHMGSSLITLAFSLREESHESTQAIEREEIHFEQRAWYSPREFPIEFSSQDFPEVLSAVHSIAGLECLSQHEFDYEAFLASFFAKYTAFRHLHLVDYDFRLVQANLREGALFMTCVADLESSPSASTQRIDQSRLALFVAIEIFTGEYHVLRALKVPRLQALRPMSKVTARKFLGDLTKRYPPDPTSTEWDDNPVVLGESLDVVHNPRFPISIFFK